MSTRSWRPTLVLSVLLIAVLSVFAVMPVCATGETAELHVLKFYDANANGVWDGYEEVFLDNWLISINGQNYCTPTDAEFHAIILPFELGTPITLTEALPVQSNWRATTPVTRTITLPYGYNNHYKFGNLCLGPGGGKTPGFWSNKNGEARMGLMPMSTALSELRNLNLWVRDPVTGAVTPFDPTTYAQFRTWLQNRNAIDMRYQLSAFVAAMKLNTMAGFVDGDDLIFVGGGSGYMTVDDVLDAANTALGDGSPRSELATLKNALDNACNNRNFVQPDAESCPYTFAEATCPLTAG